MDELIFLVEMKQKNGYDKKKQSTVKKSVDSAHQEKEQWQGAQKDEEQKRAMKAQPRLQRLNIGGAWECRTGRRVHRSKTNQPASGRRTRRLEFCSKIAVIRANETRRPMAHTYAATRSIKSISLVRILSKTLLPSLFRCSCFLG